MGGMKRKEWQGKALTHSRSAKLLLSSGHYDTAYYLSGLAIECALKAKIAAQFKANDLPDKSLVLQIYNNGHRLAELIKLAQLAPALAAQERANVGFRAYWSTVKAWEIDARYKTWSLAEARDMVEASTKRGTGVLAWIKQHW